MTDKEKITEILKAYTKKHNISASSVILEEYAEELLANGVIVPPCKVGDYILWNNGFKDSKDRLVEVKGFYYDSTDYGLRYICDLGQPIINHSGIVCIVQKEKAEEKLKELKKDER